MRIDTEIATIQIFGLISFEISSMLLNFNSLLRVRHSFCCYYLITSKCFLLSSWKYFLTASRFSLEISFVHNPCFAWFMRSDVVSSESNAAGSHLLYRNKQNYHGILWGLGCDFRRKNIFLMWNKKWNVLSI
jgi:hypothetical protein